MKFLITAILIYFAYKTFVGPLLKLKDRNQNNFEDDSQINEGEYIDYEEVD